MKPLFQIPLFSPNRHCRNEPFYQDLDRVYKISIEFLKGPKIQYGKGTIMNSIPQTALMLTLAVSALTLGGCKKNEDQYAGHPEYFASKECATYSTTIKKSEEYFKVRRVNACLHKDSTHEYPIVDLNTGEETKVPARFVIYGLKGKPLKLIFQDKYRNDLANLIMDKMGLAYKPASQEHRDFIKKSTVSYLIDGKPIKTVGNGLYEFITTFEKPGNFKNIEVKWKYEGGSSQQIKLSNVLPAEFLIE